MEVVTATTCIDWKFWSFLVAALALTLSQMPPIHILIRKAKLDLELFSKISLTHKVGNPNLELHLIINNIGGRKVRVKGIEVTVIRDGVEVAVLPAQNFIQNAGDKNTVLFTSFSLSPDEEWGHIVNFLKCFDRDEERKYRDMERILNLDILGKKASLAEDSKDLVDAEPKNVVPFDDFFDAKFVWKAGEFILKVKILSDVEKANIEKSYRFTLFEYYEEELKKTTKEFKYGSGTDIYRNPQTPLSVIVDVEEV